MEIGQNYALALYDVFSAVPEPTTLTLAALGLLGMGCGSRHSRAKQDRLGNVGGRRAALEEKEYLEIRPLVGLDAG
jgi:hypothetical protein